MHSPRATSPSFRLEQASFTSFERTLRRPLTWKSRARYLGQPGPRLHKVCVSWMDRTHVDTHECHLDTPMLRSLQTMLRTYRKYILLDASEELQE